MRSWIEIAAEARGLARRARLTRAMDARLRELVSEGTDAIEAAAPGGLRCYLLPCRAWLRMVPDPGHTVGGAGCCGPDCDAWRWGDVPRRERGEKILWWLERAPQVAAGRCAESYGLGAGDEFLVRLGVAGKADESRAEAQVLASLARTPR